ncbi:restriction endonuclease subunit S [Psychrobacter sp. Ps4]|uniref:restriction endonuclease subunit S n=1 Tax=Psychrobacter sp. Ps4 TaxID=2790958 RepID=UPI001EE047B2|nr:restriction endonuclease subunit S [Psychrobacter sp. Ps4]MCG3809867.1 restriction endonuclease subunit S [Psychrobacter sp. Ps4]
MVPNEISKLELIQARIGFIPKGWQLDKVGEALNIKNNFRKPISQEVRSLIPGPYPYYGPTKIQDYIADYEQDGTYALIGEDGDHFLKYETMRQTQFISGKCTVNNHAHIIESSDTCDSEWFYIYFQHRNITNFLSRQGAGRFKLNKATLEKLPMLVPPLPEQQKIAKILSTWDKAISTTERLIENSTQQKKALMQQLLTGKKRLLDESGERFKGEWEEVKLGKISDVRDGTHDSPEFIDVGYPLITSKNLLSSGRLDLSNVKFISEEDYLQINKRSGVNDGDILFGMIGTIGNPVKVKSSNYAIKNVALIKETGGLLNGFLIYYLSSHDIDKQIHRLNAGGTQKFVALGVLRNLVIRLPTQQEQQQIATVLTNADKEIDLLEQQLADLQQEKKALMQVLLMGKKRVVVDE